jgi:hypothetical protein
MYHDRDRVAAAGWTASQKRASVRAAWLAGFGGLVLAGCSAGAGGAGPLAAGGGPGTECAPVAQGQVLSDGFDAVSNPGQAPATIQAVSLTDPHDLRLVAVYIVPVTGGFLYGVRAGYPPALPLDPGVLWSQRHPAAGASVVHSDNPHHVSNIVMVLKPTASVGTAAGTRVSYRVGTTDYQFVIPIKVVVPVGRNCPAG